jgi:TIR domain-containing protein
MTYKYSLDNRTVGDIWFHKSTFEFLQAGLIRLRDQLEEWNAREVEPPYPAEVRDLTRMIDWSAQRLARLTDQYDDLYVNGISVGSLRYFKAGAILQVLEAEEELQQTIAALPSGVIAARRRNIAQMKERAEVGIFADLDPADCLWEVAPTAPVRTPAIHPEGRNPRWDVFICHASEDKEPFVRTLADWLVSEEVSVWYDDFVLRMGDSLRRSIERGLLSSRYGVVVLSPRFFSKEWPQKELDGMAALEVDGRKVILPVWHEVGRDEVRGYSPLLADRVAIRSELGVEIVAKGVLKVLRSPEI